MAPLSAPQSPPCSGGAEGDPHFPDPDIIGSLGSLFGDHSALADLRLFICGANEP
jgi:hypothetical protein